MLRAAVADLLERHVQPQGLTDQPARAYDAQTWMRLADAGLTGVLVPPEHGGTGLSLVECGCVLEGLGRSLAACPYLTSSVVAVYLLGSLPSHPKRDRLLAAIAAGSTLTSPLLPEIAGDAVIHCNEGREVLTASYAPVLYGSCADVVLAVANVANTHEWKLVMLSPATTGYASTSVELPDHSRDTCIVQINDLALSDALHVWPVSAAVAMRARLVAAAALSADMLGGTAHVLALACNHARERQQFGQPIGRFQAIKHLLADDRVMLDGLESLVYAALWSLSEGTPDAEAAASAAKAWASEVYTRVASDAIQVFGAMGIATESLPHRYLKRSHVDRIAFGGIARHLDSLNPASFAQSPAGATP